MTRPADERAVTASYGAMLQTIPNARVAISVAATAAKVNLAALGSPAVDLRGKWIFFAVAPNDDAVHFMRGDHVASLTTNMGAVAKSGELSLPFWVDPELETELTTIAASTVSMDVLYDDGT